MKYKNPILYGDYSDPDVIRVESDFYMISSSFTYIPGIPILHSRDLVNWRLIGYAAKNLPFARYEQPAHGRGAFAPSLRWVRGVFYVYVCLPDEGLVCFTSRDPAGEWEFHFVKRVCGWIDPCPLFDDDGNAYLVHALAASRVGINNMLFVHRLSPDGLSVLDKGALVFNGADAGDVTTEGPKFYKRNGEYYILCPAGGVENGYQLALRAPSPFGPYARRVVLSQGGTSVNGPHQGGWVDDGHGGDWFLHFQDAGVYGRIPHLQPVKWADGWPEMGANGAPAAGGETPFEETERVYPVMSDDFHGEPGLQWQYQANYKPFYRENMREGLCLRAIYAKDVFSAGQFLSQLMQRENFDMEVSLTLNGQFGDMAGIAMMGYTYHYLAVMPGRIALIQGEAQALPDDDGHAATETRLASRPFLGGKVRMRMRVRKGVARFFVNNQPIGEDCSLAKGGWTGARPGIFCISSMAHSEGSALFEYCHVTDENGNEI